MGARHVSCFLVMLLAFVGQARGNPPGGTPAAQALAVDQAAERVMAAVAAGDTAVLKALAAEDEPDPWLVADALVRRGAHDAAVAFAKAAPRPDTEALPAHVEARRTRAPDAAEPALLDEVDALLAAGDARAVVARTDGLAVADGPVGFRLRRARGRGLAALRRVPESLAELRSGAEAAVKMGWLRGGTSLYGEAIAIAYDHMDRAQTFACIDAALALQTRRGDVEGKQRLVNTRGSAYHRFGEYAEAHATFERLLADVEAQGNAKLAATIVGNMGVVYRDQKDFAAALSQFEEARERHKARGDRAGVAWALASQGQAYSGLGAHAKALAAYTKAVAEQEPLGDPGPLGSMLFEMAYVHQALGDRPAALATLERAAVPMDASGNKGEAARIFGTVALLRTSLGEHQAALLAWKEAVLRADAAGFAVLSMEARNHMGLIYSNQRALTEAIAMFEENLRHSEASGDKAWMAASLINMGRTYVMQRDRATALRHLERGLGLALETGQQEWARVGMSAIADVLAEGGEPGKALSVLAQFRDQRKAAADVAGVASALALMGGIHCAKGDFTKALALLREALQHQEAVSDVAGAGETLNLLGLAHRGLGEYAKALSAHEQSFVRKQARDDVAGMAGVLINMGTVYIALGDHASAKSHLERGLALAERSGHRPWIENALNNLGVLHLNMADPQLALETWQRGRAAYAALGDTHGVAVTLENIGCAYAQMGEFAKALAAHLESLELVEKLGDKAGLTISMSNIGRAYQGLGDAPKARTYYERGAREAKSRRQTPELVLALTRLAGYHLWQGDPAAALGAAKEALDQTETMLTGLGEEQGAQARAEFAGLYGLGAQAAARAGDAAELLRFLESGRACALLDALDRRDLIRWKAESLPEELRRLDVEAQAREREAREALERAYRGEDREARRAALQALDEALEGQRQVNDRIQREVNLRQQAALFYPRAKTLEEIGSTLTQDQALVLYGLCQEEALALVVRPDGGRVVSLGKSSALIAACEALDASKPGTDPEAALHVLRAWLVAPLELEEDVRQVLISPEGRLCYVPFNALFEQTVTLTPSGTTHVALAEEAHAWGQGVLALGDPDYAGVSGGARATYYRGRPLAALPSTRVEAGAVGTKVLLGADASEPGFHASGATSPRWSAVHLACHGLVNVEKPMLSALALSRAGESDGFLTAREVLWTKVPADLVVLSACETAVGRIVRGEGIVGLTRAFMFAGAPRVICSLWKVDDEATAALMLKFYELWLGASRDAVALSEPGAPPGAPGGSKGPNQGQPKLSAAEALRQAQEHVRAQAKWRHPYYWAAWVLWGLPS
jgi:CHAT domain-containing protein/tetratricopeptide (TPR) repeat protein